MKKFLQKTSQSGKLDEGEQGSQAPTRRPCSSVAVHPSRHPCPHSALPVFRIDKWHMSTWVWCDLGPGVRLEFYLLSVTVVADLHHHVDQLTHVDSCYPDLRWCREMSVHRYSMESFPYAANEFEVPRHSAIGARSAAPRYLIWF